MSGALQPYSLKNGAFYPDSDFCVSNADSSSYRCALTLSGSNSSVPKELAAERARAEKETAEEVKAKMVEE